MELQNLKNYFLGRFEKKELRTFLLVQLSVIWLLILIAYLLYPPSEYSIMRHTFSYLGSQDAHNNPEGWYWFSIALIAMGILMIPLILYRHRRLSKIDPNMARFNTLLLIIGAIGIFLLAFFPDDGRDFMEDLSYGRIHNQLAVVAFAGLGLGNIFDSFIFLKDRWPKWPLGGGGTKILNHKKLQIPVIGLFIVVFCTAFFLIRWEIIYPEIHAQNPEIGSWPGEGIYSFPLWEWIVIVYLFIYITATMLIYPNKIEE